MKYYLFILIFLGANLVTAQNFKEKTQEPPIIDVSSGTSVFMDIDDDGDLDLVLTGIANDIGKVSKLYTNDGFGNFTEVDEVPFDKVSNSTTTFSDIDGDGDQDLLITGENNQQERIAKLYSNDGDGNFSEIQEPNLEGVLAGSVAFVDVDNDGDDDLVIAGTGEASLGISTKLYLNSGSGGFQEDLDVSFEGVRNGSIAVTDIDGDDDIDILISGENKSFNEIIRLYINDGLGNFNLSQNSSFEAVSNGSIVFVDIDNDLDDDLFISGLNEFSVPVSKFYLNNGVGIFDGVLNTSLESIYFSSVDFSDVDNDNDQDLLIAGLGIEGNVSKLYLNDGSANFTEDLNTPLQGLFAVFVTFADVNGDDNEDLFITGAYPLDGGIVLESTTSLYLNDVATATNDLELDDIKIDAFPNPTTGDFLNVVVKLENTELIMLEIYDMRGERLSEEKISMHSGQNNYKCSLPPLTSGTYLVKVSNGIESGSKTFTVH